MSAYDDEHRRVMRIQEEMARYEAISITEQQIARFSRISQDVVDQQRIMRDIERSDEVHRKLEESFGVSRRLEDLLATQERHQRFSDQMMQPALDIAALEAATRPYEAFLDNERAERESRRWIQLHESLAAQDALQAKLDRVEKQARLTWELNLGTLSADFASLPGPPSSAVLAAMLDPAYAFSEFTRASVARLAAAPTAESLAITTSVALAEGQLRAGTQLVGATALAVIENAVGSDGAAGSTEEPKIATSSGLSGDHAGSTQTGARISVFDAQYQQIREAGSPPVTSGYDWVLEVAPTARGVRLGQMIVRRITEINDACRLNGSAQVFPATNAMLTATTTMSYPSVHDKVSLGNAVDALYILLYEASGEMQRVLDRVADETCRPVWTLKHLRNLWLRHDSEHGTTGDQARKSKDLRAAFDYLRSNVPPHSSVEYRALFERLLERLCEFLDALLEAIAKEPRNA